MYSASEWVKDMPTRHGAFTRERMNTRRPQCTYGWDWVARFLTCGLGQCSIIVFDDFVILPENVYIATIDADDESATVRADLTLPFEYEGRVLEFLILSPDGSVACRTLKYCKEDFIRLDFDVSAPQLWYPIGYGEQPLYTFAIKHGDDLVYSERIGIRTVKIMQRIDPIGSKNYEIALSIKNQKYDFNETFSEFVLKINGEKVFCRGANWVPCVPFGMGNIDSRQTETLELCAEAGVNMLRVWGGGAFESRYFYNECSHLGIMVTQDFLMACGNYPEEQEWFIEHLRKEAEYAALTLRNHTCLAWWSGDNENAVDGNDNITDYTGYLSSSHGLEPTVRALDPYREFLPSSPYGGDKYSSATRGTTHISNFLGEIYHHILEGDLSDYDEYFAGFYARFIAEQPTLGMPFLSTLRRFMTDDDIFGEDESISEYHTKHNPELGEVSIYGFIRDFTEKLFGKFKSGEDRLLKMQMLQCEWVRKSFELTKRNKWFSSGIIYWMFNGISL